MNKDTQNETNRTPWKEGDRGSKVLDKDGNLIATLDFSFDITWQERQRIVGVICHAVNSHDKNIELIREMKDELKVQRKFIEDIWKNNPEFRVVLNKLDRLIKKAEDVLNNS